VEAGDLALDTPCIPPSNVERDLHGDLRAAPRRVLGDFSCRSLKSVMWTWDRVGVLRSGQS